MTQEEKAKAYDEALEKARQLCAYPTSKPFISDLQDLFPELAESEDERIRKALIKYLDALDDDEIRYGVSFKDMRTWLEKQSKASKVEQAMREVEEKADAFTEAHKGETSDEILAQMRGEQKPAEFIKECLTTIKEVATESGELNTEFETKLINAFKWLEKQEEKNIILEDKIARLQEKLRDFGCEL
jgi:CRISPR/Cas system Type II protein with McrA/HNH and RuvC-like nuclease domain